MIRYVRIKHILNDSCYASDVMPDMNNIFFSICIYMYKLQFYYSYTYFTYLYWLFNIQKNATNIEFYT